jgi:hypothetical protein
MRLLTMLAILLAVGLGAFSLAMRGLGAFGNFAVFATAAVGLLLVTVNLTAVKRKAAPQGSGEGERGAEAATPGASRRG